ncbi:DNA polymerase III subunit alpha [Mesomycoplasma neurolyticum]|uniref:DNA-directed DNA polymerase n=1 Tax=Mesomycoplasma neurolyticum TaxID=2120 RepID=A0A449A645_9BACT|nr:DNA polymerase III subunit alpha [Mesomycoplasma neurolyticum]VEU59704.1 DNA polymerase III alpha subunit [Mesomycoplasma neurolyticum]
MGKIVNLNVHTEYSFLESTIKIDKLFDYAKQNNIKTIVITDRNNMFALPKFLKKAKEFNIKPIIGVDLDVENYRFILLAKNYQGYQFLAKLVSKKNNNNVISLLEIENDNIFIIDHPDYGIYAKNNQLLNYKNFYISTNDESVENSIYVNETKILTLDEYDALETLKSISKKDFNTKKYLAFALNENVSEIVSKRINNIINQINVIFPERPNFLPKFKNNENLTSEQYLKKIIFEKLKEKEIELKKYKDSIQRINYEFNIIKNLKFADYFLIIWDLIKWSKEQNILVGPGRGSVSGSLIAFVLNITEVNPLKYGLYFERFLNPERITMPDIDIDIADNRREEVLQYLSDKYGFKNFSSIITFQSLGAKMAIRDVARIHNVPITEVNELTKRMFDDTTTLKQTYENSPKFKAKIDSNPLYQKIYQMAKKIEGLPRQFGTHAAGIVLSSEEIENIVPTILNDKGYLETQFSMEYLEDFGLLKIDILALKNLSIVQEIIEFINNSTNLKLEFKDIPLYDVQTNILLSKGQTTGIFQLESPGMKNTLKKVGISSLDDLASVISLFRPGPMENISEYVKRKQGAFIPKISKVYDDILSSTYGIIVYQEQIMEICQKIANLSFAEADIFRKAISKKDYNNMHKLKTQFINNAIKQNYSENLVTKIFKSIEYFAEYGFNKAHAVAYAVLAYKMAYLKTKYPLFFFSSLINNARGSHDVIKKYVAEANEYNIEILPPSINVFDSISDLPIIEDNKIYLPLIMIKGLGNVATQKLLKIRSEKPFDDLIDFLIRMNENKISKSIIKILIESNALREFGSQQKIKSIFNAFNVENNIYDFDKNNSLIKEIVDNFAEKIDGFENKDDIEEIQKNELNYLGIIFTKAAKKSFEGEIRLADMRQGNKYVLPLQVLKISPFYDKKHQLMAKIELSDSSKQISAFIFSSYWKNIENKIKINKIYEFEILKNTRGYSIYKLIKEIYEK